MDKSPEVAKDYPSTMIDATSDVWTNDDILIITLYALAAGTFVLLIVVFFGVLRTVISYRDHIVNSYQLL